MAKGIGWAHRWSKPREPWKPTPVFHDGVWSGRPSVLLAAETKRLETLWQCAPDPPPLDPPASLDHQLPQLSVTQLREALQTFSSSTAESYDGVHQSHLKMLEDVHLSAFVHSSSAANFRALSQISSSAANFRALSQIR
jgi:hypothetical protein